MNAKKIWTTCALSALAVLATASVGSSLQLRGPGSKQTTDAGSILAETGTPLCFGDGTGSVCGGKITGDPGRGCENSLGLGGARLAGRGSARLSQDNLVLEASYIPLPTTVLFLQSDAMANGGKGYPFGDGVMCLQGTTRLLAVQQPRDFWMAVYPKPGDPPLSLAGKVNMHQPTQYYQVMYRDSVPTRGHHFNLTNALEVVWGL